MPEKIKYTTLEERLYTLCQKAQESSLSIEEVMKILAGKGHFLLIIFLSLPFCQPIQFPGLSTPFGLIIAFLGLRVGFGKKIMLPRFLLNKHFSSSKILKITDASLKIFGKLKFFTRPRLSWMCHHPKMRILNGLYLCFQGIVLALPLPIPLSNIVAGWIIFLMAFGILEDDGLIVLLSYLISLIAIVFFISLFWIFT